MLLNFLLWKGLNLFASKVNRWVICDEFLSGLVYNYVDNQFSVNLSGRCEPLCYIREISGFNELDNISRELGDNVGKYINLDDMGSRVDKESRELLNKLKAHVSKAGMKCYNYEVPWHRQGITLQTHEPSISALANQIKADLKFKIKEANSASINLDDCLQETRRHLQFCERKANTFQGRGGLLRQIKHYTEQVEQKYPLVISGITGSGKTSLLAKAAIAARSDLKASGRDPVIVVRFCGTTPDSSSARLLMRSICEQVIRAYEDDMTLLKDMDFTFANIRDLFKSLCGNSKLPSQRRPLCIFIDSLDQLSDENNARRILDWIPSRMAAHTFLVVSTLPKVGGCLSALRARSADKQIPAKNYVEIGSPSDEDVFEIYRITFSSLKRQLTSDQLQYVLKLATDDSVEMPTTLRLKLLLDISIKWRSFDPLPDLKPTVRGLINYIFSKLEGIYGKPLVSTFCGLLAISKYGLPENDLQDLLSLDEEVLDSVLQYDKPPVRRLPYHILSNLIYDLDEYLVDRGGHGTTLKYWYHRQFWEAAEARYLSSINKHHQTVTMQNCSKAMVDYYSGKAQDDFPDRLLRIQPYFTINNGNIPIFNLVALTQLPNALLRCEEYNGKLKDLVCNALLRHEEYNGKLKGLVCNMKFTAICIAAGLGIQLIPFLNEAMKIDHCNKQSYIAYKQFLAVNLHILERKPELILQLAVNMPHDVRSKLDIASGMMKIDVSDFLPWVDSSQHLLAITTTKSQTSHQCSLAFTMDSPVVNIEMVSEVGEGPIIVAATQNKYILVCTSASSPLMIPCDGTKMIVTQGGLNHFYILTLSEEERRCSLTILKVNIGKNCNMTCEFLSSHFVAEPSESEAGDMVSTYVSPSISYSFALSPDKSKIVTSYVFTEDFFPPQTKPRNKMKLFGITPSFGTTPNSGHDVKTLLVVENNDPVNTLAFSSDGQFVIAGLFQERAKRNAMSAKVFGTKERQTGLKKPNVKFYTSSLQPVAKSEIFLTNMLDSSSRELFSTPIESVKAINNGNMINVIACLKHSLFSFDLYLTEENVVAGHSQVLGMEVDLATCFVHAENSSFLCVGSSTGNVDIFNTAITTVNTSCKLSSVNTSPIRVPNLFQKVSSLHLGPEEVIYDVSCMENCSKICTGLKSFVRLWDITMEKSQNKPSLHINHAYYCHSRTLLVTCDDSNKVQFWNAKTAKLKSEIQVNVGDDENFDIVSIVLSNNGKKLAAKVNMHENLDSSQCDGDLVSKVIICNLFHSRFDGVQLLRTVLLGRTSMQGNSLAFSSDGMVLFDGFPERTSEGTLPKSGRQRISKVNGPVAYDLKGIFKTDTTIDTSDIMTPITSETRYSLHGKWSCDGEHFVPMTWISSDYSHIAFNVYKRLENKLFPLCSPLSDEYVVDCYFLTDKAAIVLLCRDKKYELHSQLLGTELQMLSIPGLKLLGQADLNGSSIMSGFSDTEMGDFIIAASGKTVTVFQADSDVPELMPISTFITEIGVTCVSGFVSDQILHVNLADSIGQLHVVKIGQGFHMTSQKGRPGFKRAISESHEAMKALITK